LILEGPPIFKMTYECSNASERFKGELFVGNKWEHFFSMLDLGVVEEKSMYVREEIVRKQRCRELQKLGKKFYENMKK
jgi:hypothetical protein